MPPKKKNRSAKPSRNERSSFSKLPFQRERPIQDDVDAVLARLKRSARKSIREEVLPRYGIHTDKAFGVSMANLKLQAKRLGSDHELAAALWDTGWYDARMLASMINDPARVTSAQMNRWCRDFDNWGICDTVCFVLFDRTPHAWRKVTQWSGRRDEFVKRAAFALLWGLTVHDKQAADKSFVQALALIERAAVDERHYVKKAVNMALRAIGKRNPALNVAAIALAQRLSTSSSASARWVGRDALRELTGPSVTRRLAARHG